jgi:hypothetical protein
MNHSLLEEVKKWKVEAKLEDSNRYFFHINEVDNLINGEKTYVIGRKGTGKTAISEYIDKKLDPSKFTQKLTFKNFPFNALYKLDNSSYTSPNQYITLWKYVIYNTVAKLFIKNQQIDSLIRNELSKLYPEDLSRGLPRAVRNWTSGNFSIKIFGCGITFGGSKDQLSDDLNWIERVDIIEEFLLKNMDDSKYLIMFDELDEDYRDMLSQENFKRYTQLLTGLFKAVQDIRSIFRGHKLYPIIFLRDDIYSILQDPDKTKWDDLRITLDWSEHALKNLIAFRLSRAISAGGNIFSFTSAWDSIFSKGEVSYGDRGSKKMAQYKYILRSTLLRPRDLVKYIQLCASKTIEKNENKISASTIAHMNLSFSNYLRSELEDEINGAIPEIHSILGLFTQLRKQTLRREEFIDLYLNAIHENKLPKRDPVVVLNILFHFSVIGGQPKQRTFQVFKYIQPDSGLNPNDNIIIHRGLYRALQIL